MQDRAPTKPNRYAVYDDSHNLIGYQYHERADEPTQEGTPLNKATLAKDATLALFGLANAALPDDVLVAIKTLLDSKAKIATGSYTGTGTYGSANKNSLTFSFVPKFFVVQPAGSTLYGNAAYQVTMIALRGAPVIQINSLDTYWITLSWSGNTVSWYHNNSDTAQNNVSGVTYNWIALG